MKNYVEINAAQKASETDPFTIDRYKQFFNYFPSHTKYVLDVGCNTGRGGKIIKQLNQNLEIIGLDCVQPRLKEISLDIYTQTIYGYSTNIDSKDASFDLVLAGEFIEHLYSADVSQTLREFYRVIKPNGRVLLTTPNPNYLRLKLTGGSVLGGAHVSQHEHTELKKELAEVGFVNVQVRGSGKVSRILGENFPFLTLYGSYLAIADKT